MYFVYLKETQIFQEMPKADCAVLPLLFFSVSSERSFADAQDDNGGLNKYPSGEILRFARNDAAL